MKLTKEVLVRIIRQEINQMQEEESLEDTIGDVQDEKTDKIIDVVGPLIDNVSALVIDKFSQGAENPELKGVVTPEEVTALGAEALKQAITDKIEDMSS